MIDFNFYGRNIGDMITIKVPEHMRVDRENPDTFIVCDDYVPELIKKHNKKLSNY